MSHWLGYVFLITGLIEAVQLAFGYENSSTEKVTLCWMLIVLGLLFRALDEARLARRGKAVDAASLHDREIAYASYRAMSMGLAAAVFLGMAITAGQNFTSLSSESWFWTTLPVLFIFLFIFYLKQYRLAKFLFEKGQEATAIIESVAALAGAAARSAEVRYRFEVPEKGMIAGKANCALTPWLPAYEPGAKIQVLYDPDRPSRNILLPPLHGQDLHLREE